MKGSRTPNRGIWLLWTGSLGYNGNIEYLGDILKESYRQE